jgi:hypothetical protein
VAKPRMPYLPQDGEDFHKRFDLMSAGSFKTGLDRVLADPRRQGQRLSVEMPTERHER